MRTKILSILLLLAFLSLFNQTYAQDYYPINDGDFWEYFESDSNAAIFGENEFFTCSITKEVLGDTLMSNGIIYKKIKWENIANSVTRSPRYEFQRKDSIGNIYLFYENKDCLMLDFSKNNGETYSSHLPGWNWKVSRYIGSPFYNPHPVVSFSLDSAYLLRRWLICAEDKGVELDEYEYDGYYEYYEYEDTMLVEGKTKQAKLWGAIVNGIQYGNILARKQKINWSDFYPLHLGDVWSYYIEENGNETRKIIRIESDTIMSDGNLYFKRDGQYERIDSLGNIYIWNSADNSGNIIFRFSSVCGDTINLKEHLVFSKDLESYGRFNRIIAISFPFSPGYSTHVYAQGIGLWSKGFQGVDTLYTQKLAGAYINGVLVYGDTTNYNIKTIENNSEILTKYALNQNYPNPFNPATNITFQLPKESFVSLIVYNMLGEKVETLLNEYRGVGKHTVTFDAHNLPSGIYFYTLQTNGLTETKKMLLLK